MAGTASKTQNRPFTMKGRLFFCHVFESGARIGDLLRCFASFGDLLRRFRIFMQILPGSGRFHADYSPWGGGGEAQRRRQRLQDLCESFD